MGVSSLIFLFALSFLGVVVSGNNDSFPDNKGKWSIPYSSEDVDGPSCILISGAFQLNVLHETGVRKIVDVPPSAQAIGKCEDDIMSYIVLRWNSTEDGVELNNGMSITFMTEGDGKEYYIIGLGFSTTKKTSLINIESALLQNNTFKERVSVEIGSDFIYNVDTVGRFLPSSVNHSVQCTSQEILKGKHLSVSTANLKFEAFRPKNLMKNEFDPSSGCNNTFSSAKNSTDHAQSGEAPSDKFPLNIGNWSAPTDPITLNHSCILMKGAIQLSYMDFFSRNISVVDVPKNADLLGSSCDNETMGFSLKWEDTLASTTYFLQIAFDSVNSKDHYHISMLDLIIRESNVLNATDLAVDFHPLESNIGTIYNMNGSASVASYSVLMIGQYFSTPLNRSYLCTMENTITSDYLNVTTASFQFEAFRPLTLPYYEFDTPELCKADVIAVGGVIGIVIGSVVAGLIGICLGIFLAMRYGLCPCIRWCKRGNSEYAPLINQ